MCCNNTLRKLVLFGSMLWITQIAALDNATIAVMMLGDNSAMVEVGNKIHSLTVGSTSPEGVKLIATDAEKAIAVLEIDGQQATYQLGMRINKKIAPSTVTPQDLPPIRVFPNAQGMYMVAGYIDSYPVNFLIDTGATTVAMSSQQAYQLNIDYKRGRAAAVSTASGIAKAYRVTLNRTRVGHITLYALDALVIEGRYPTEILLGLNALDKMEMHREDRVIVLQTRQIASSIQRLELPPKSVEVQSQDIYTKQPIKLEMRVLTSPSTETKR